MEPSGQADISTGMCLASIAEFSTVSVRQVAWDTSVGIDSWGVDYGLLDADGTLLGNPVHYRDDRTRAIVDPVAKSVGAFELYRRSGIAVVPFNTIFQLVAGRDNARRSGCR